MYSPRSISKFFNISLTCSKCGLVDCPSLHIEWTRYGVSIVFKSNTWLISPPLYPTVILSATFLYKTSKLSVGIPRAKTDDDAKNQLKLPIVWRSYNLSENASEFERKSSDGREQMRYIYQQAFIKLQQKLTSDPRSMNFIIGTGIKQFATQDNAGVVDDNGNTVELIDLTRGEATIFDFKNVASKLSDVRLEAEYGVGGRSNLPTISILDADSRKL